MYLAREPRVLIFDEAISLSTTILPSDAGVMQSPHFHLIEYRPSPVKSHSWHSTHGLSSQTMCIVQLKGIRLPKVIIEALLKHKVLLAINGEGSRKCWVLLKSK